jgi:hypothetical protein
MNLSKSLRSAMLMAGAAVCAYALVALLARLAWQVVSGGQVAPLQDEWGGLPLGALALGAFLLLLVMAAIGGLLMNHFCSEAWFGPRGLLRWVLAGAAYGLAAGLFGPLVETLPAGLLPFGELALAGVVYVLVFRWAMPVK